ncbi:unnamed protein product, partial [Porites lobata]
MPQVQVKEELRRLVALEYPGADVPEVDQFKDEMVVFDGLVIYSTVDPENAIRERITAKLRERRVSHIDLSQCDKNDFEFVKVVNKKIRVPDGDEMFDARTLGGIYKHGAYSCHNANCSLIMQEDELIHVSDKESVIGDGDLMKSAFAPNSSSGTEQPSCSASSASSSGNLRRQVNGKIVRLTVTEETAVEDALAYYKHPDFDARCPIRITFEKQPAVDAGGPRRQFYSMVFSALEDFQQYKLFEGPPGRLMPVYSASHVFSGLMKILGKMLAHSIVQCGVRMPVFSPVLYWYIITGDV